jgi:gamma-glutamyltranspeptidase/glutathione hydrolase
MVAAPHPMASVAGIDALRAGGNAIDAAVAANAMLAVVYNHACGLGGDAFALLWSAADGRLVGYNGSGHAPAALTRDEVRRRGHSTMPSRGALSVTVPGAVDAWAELLHRYGRRTLADALLPAADVAERGHVVSDRSAAALAASETLLLGDPLAAATFLPGGRAPRPGALLRQTSLAATMRLIALEGRDAYYRGPIAREIVRALQASGGVMEVDDLAAHDGEWVDPIRTAYRDAEVAALPPNSQGITALIALNVLTAMAGSGWSGLPADAPLAAGAPLSAERVHAQVEALKTAWAERDRIGPDAAAAGIDLAEVLSAAHAATLAPRPEPQAAGPTPLARAGGGTVYLAAGDEDGNLVSLIESNYMGFGCGVMAGSTGIMLQNRGAYFSLDDAHPNRLEPRRRTLHTLMPLMLLRGGRPWAALGAMGGNGQPQTAVQLVNAVVDDGLDAQSAVERPRWVLDVDEQGRLNRLSIEADGVDDDAVRRLRALGHDVTLAEPRTPLMGWAQIVGLQPEADPPTLVGGADPRADSLALGW